MPPTSAAVRIVTDTTAVLPADYASAHLIEVAPQVVLFGEESFLEDVEISYADFIRRLKTAAQLPKTAAPPPGEMVKAYARQLAQARTILSIHPSVEVSGTVRSAFTAKEESFPDADIRILDTRTVAGNLATLVILAAEWAEAGVSADEILRRLQALIPRGRTYFLVATLEYLQKGGRIGGASALIGSALQIKPILQLKDGRVEALEKVRTQHRALERLKELVVEQCPRSPEAHLCVMHADDLDEAQRLAGDLKSLLGLSHIPICSLGASITTHAGPGTLAVGFFV
ncbi:MAG TPA: DegV family protein [Anaerolineae bacterium]|nr:DegV family protein [Anaerolineae bacterium]